MIKFDRLPDGKLFALTLSYDDGRDCDRRLIEIMNKHGIRGTFHLNSGRLGAADMYVYPEEICDLYRNHEISCHGVNHYNLTFLPQQNISEEIGEDRKYFENLTGKIIRGMSYAYGSYDENVISALKKEGMVYSRTVKSTHSFNFPSNFLAWDPTCHHRDCLELAKTFLTHIDRGYRPFARLFYVWGHSYEFENNDNWDIIEKFCELMGGRDDIWYATNIEIYEYVTAQRSLVISADNKIVYNPSAIRVWFSVERDVFSIGPGETIKL